MMEKLQPKLRFPEFEGKWNTITLYEISENGFSNGAFNDPKKVGYGYRIINVKDMYIDGVIETNLLTRVALDEKEFKNALKHLYHFGLISTQIRYVIKEAFHIFKMRLQVAWSKE